MLCNVIDSRKRPYRWAKINAIIEATWHDNTVSDSDPTPPPSPEDEITYDQRENISLSEAIIWANSQPCPVTLFLYDEGSGTT